MSTGIHVISTGSSTVKYYRSLNRTFHHLFGKHMMLHYPLYMKEGESLETRQKNLTDYCLRETPILHGKRVLEIGCGNGSHGSYILGKYQPALLMGVDLNPENIAIARQHFQQEGKLEFIVDNAQTLHCIADNSFDLVLCIESAFHYPDKPGFLKQVQRVLVPGGSFVIADILNQMENRRYMTPRWKRKMSYHHWTVKRYEVAFRVAGLHLIHQENITAQVIRGYEGHQYWVMRQQNQPLLNYFLFRLFSTIQVRINLRLLRNKEHYWLFQGKKL